MAGAVLLEFAILALVFYLLLATLISFGHLFFTAQAVQDGARLGALELARTPLPAEYTFDQALASSIVRQRIYDPGLLVVDLDNIPGGVTLDEYFRNAPVLNQALWPVMVVQRIGGRRLLHYPGALLEDPSTPTGLRVAIPVVRGRDADGVETISWVEPVEEIRADPEVSPFRLNAAGTQQGIVALRVNYPYQSAALSGFREAAGGPFEPNAARPIEADPGAVTQLPGDVRSVRADTGDVGPYAGPYGLGRLKALGKDVRPFRRLLSAQAVFRREVFE
ncbi:MAG: pilus assembly protein [Planctomycetes bacterium]|jgi:hypothetical protein|nr:pilus assembly protein [Planctomycetota bacterium]